MRKIFFLSLFLLSFNAFSQDASIKYCNFLSSDSINTYLQILTSDSLEGRETGHIGQKRAAHYLSSKYLSWNLTPYAIPVVKGQKSEINNFLQQHTINSRSNKGRNLSINKSNFLYGRDFIYPHIQKDTSIFFNDLIFIGSKNETDIKNALASDRYSSKNFVIYGLENAESAIKLLSESNRKMSSVFIITGGDEIKKYFINGFPAQTNLSYFLFMINDSVGQKLFPDEKYFKTIDRISKKEKTIVKELTCEGSVGMVKDADILQGENVIAMIPGQDLTNQTIVISSHYDHLGIKDSAIYRGADDNASGTSAVLEMARIFKKAKDEGRGPRRNILFLNVSGEEKGLLGSSWFVANPVIPLDNIVANLNIDMIGRTDSIHDSTGVRNYVYIIGADKLSTQLNDINNEQNRRRTKLELDFKYNSDDDPNHFYRRSDHYNFAKKGIPVIFYFDGKHADYHLPSDTADKIDFYLLTERARLVFLTAWELANRTERIVVDKKPGIDK